jgi:hypothetical protein
LERRLAQPHHPVPAITLDGHANGAPHADASACASKYEYR